MPSLGYLILYNLIPEIGEKLEVAASQILRKAAFDCEAAAKGNAPVDTGYMRDSIYTRTNTSSSYGRVGEPPPGAELLPEVEKPDRGTAIVAVGANYGIFVEFGTSKMAAQPYLIPAAEAVGPSFVAAMAELESFLTGSVVVPDVE